MNVEKPPSLLFVTDERLSRDKAGVLTRTVSQLKQNFSVQTLHGHETSENAILEKIAKEHFDLVLAPFHKYQTWNRIEGHLGLNRTSGPTFAGYFCEPQPLAKLPEPTGKMRRIILDFLDLTPAEIQVLIRSLIVDQHRSGLKPLLKQNTTIFCESWYGNQGQGTRIDQILNLPDLANGNWNKRFSSIRFILSAFWSLVYEEGPGKSEVAQNPSNPKAYFQIGMDANVVCMRLYFYMLPHWSPKDAIQEFWPDRSKPTKAAQVLLRFADFLRVHTVSETADIEIVAGLFHSSPAEKSPDHLHSLWVEPLAAKLIIEPPFETPGPKSPQLKALANVSMAPSKLRLVSSQDTLQDLKSSLNEKEEIIRELRSGGLGTAKPLPPPDAEGLLEAFQQRFFEARFQIRQFELQIDAIQKQKPSPQQTAQMADLKLKMEALINRENAWIKKIMQILEAFRESKKNSST